MYKYVHISSQKLSFSCCATFRLDMQSLYETQTLLDSTCFGVYKDTASYPSLDSRGPPHPQVLPSHVAVSSSPSQCSADTAPSRCPNSNSPLADQRVTKHCDNATSSSSSTITPSTDLADSIPYDQLRKEVFGNTLNMNTLNTSSNFLKQLLPPERLPFPVNEDLLRKLSAPIRPSAPIWNGLRNCFHQSPTNFGQAAICDWLNSIGTAMGLVYGHQCERLWWGNFEVPQGPLCSKKILSSLIAVIITEFCRNLSLTPDGLLSKLL